MTDTIDPGALARELAAALPIPTTGAPRFLARGEHSLNYLVEVASAGNGGPLVARLVTGARGELSLPEQARHEARALALLEPSGRTPRLIAVVPEPDRLPWPLLVATWLPGRPLDYARDLAAAARCVADIHALGVPPEHGLPARPDPGPALLAEARAWAAPYLAASPSGAQPAAAMRAAFDAVARELAAAPSAPADLAIVNGDLCARNFVVDDEGLASLLDWEQARVAPAAQDIAHFLLPTTTLAGDDGGAWLTREQERAFLEIYLAARAELDRERFLAQLARLKRLVALRAVAGCAGALAAAGPAALEDPPGACALFLEPDFLAGLFGL